MVKESSVIKDFLVTKEGLEITFQSGEKYLYPEVTLEQCDELQKAESKGKYFMKVIRPQKYKKITK